MWCTNCGTKLPDGAKFCPKCGEMTDLQNAESLYCTNCGKIISADAEFCVHCGKRMREKPKEGFKAYAIGKAVDYVEGKVEDGAEQVITTMVEQITTPHSAAETADVVMSAPQSVDVQAAATQAQAMGAGSQAAPTFSQVSQTAQASQAQAMGAGNQAAPTFSQVSQTAQATQAQAMGAGRQAAPTFSQVSQTAQASQAQAMGAGRKAARTISQVAQAAPTPQPPVSGIRIPTVPVQAAGVAASVGAEAAKVAGSVAVGGVKAAGSTAKRVAAFTLVLVFITGAISAWLGVFVSGPEKTVEQFFTSLENYDFDGMLSCVDPKLEKQIRAIMGISSGIIGGITGFDIDMEALMTISPMLKDLMEMPDTGLHVASCEVVLYADYGTDKIMSLAEQANMDNGAGLTGQYISDNDIVRFLQQYKLSIPGLEKAVARTAIVRVTFTDGNGTAYIPMQNIDKGDWRLVLDMESVA